MLKHARTSTVMLEIKRDGDRIRIQLDDDGDGSDLAAVEQRRAGGGLTGWNRRICRQVLDCGDGVGEVTALDAAVLKIAILALGTITPESQMPRRASASHTALQLTKDFQSPIVLTL